MNKKLFFLIIFFTYLNAQVKYNIFITTFNKEEKVKALEYKKTLKEYLELSGIKQKISLVEEKNNITIKIVNFSTLKNVKEVYNKIKKDFKDSFIQDYKIQSLEDIHKEALNFLKEKKANKAYEILYKEYEKNNFNNKTLFLLGDSAKQSGDIKNGIRFFEELLKLDPNANRVRLDLADLYYEDKQFKKSKEQFLIVKAAKIPPQVKSNIENYKLKKQFENRKNYSLFASLGYIKDSNVNLGPSIDTITMYDIDFTLSNDAKETSDDALSYKFNGVYYKEFKNFLLESSLNIQDIDYFDQNDYDMLIYKLSLSPIFFYHNTLYMFPINYTNLELGSSEDYYLRYYTFNPSLKRSFAPFFSYILKLNLESKEYQSLSTKDGTTYGLSYGIEFLKSKTNTINVNTYFNKNDSKEKIYSYRKLGIEMSYNDIIFNKLFFVGNFKFENTDYEEAEDAFDIKKDENTFSTSLNFIYDLNFYNSTMTFSQYYQKNSSNIDLYKYERSQSMLSFNIKF